MADAISVFFPVRPCPFSVHSVKHSANIQ
jgi:hypothetical protein